MKFLYGDMTRVLADDIDIRMSLSSSITMAPEIVNTPCQLTAVSVWVGLAKWSFGI